MKKQIIIIATLAFSTFMSNKVNAQSGWTPTSPSGDLTTNANTDKVGINTTIPPVWDLTVNGQFGFQQDNTSGGFRHISADSYYGLALLSTTTGGGWTDGSGLLLNGNRSSPHGAHNGSIDFVATPSNATDPAFKFVIGDTWDYKCVIRKDGKVCIGNVVPNTIGYDYKLYVENGILTSRVKVAIHGSGEWSDYVFADNYNLKPLNEVESFINENKHLPDVPSADEVVKNGIDVGKMDATLLQKIEELTLYVIQQQKQIDELKSKMGK